MIELHLDHRRAHPRNAGAAAALADGAEADRRFQVEKAKEPQTRTEQSHTGFDGAPNQQNETDAYRRYAAEAPDYFREQSRRHARETAQPPEEQKKQQETGDQRHEESSAHL
jgi:hypothetical protein